jgi:hypothetical protein
MRDYGPQKSVPYRPIPHRSGPFRDSADQLPAARARRIVSKRKGSPYRSGRSADWLKFKKPEAPAVKREAEEDRNCG